MRRRLLGREDVEDVIVDVYTVAWRRIEDFAAATAPLAWIYAVARKTIANQYRSRRRWSRLKAKAEVSLEPGLAHTVDGTAIHRLDVERVLAAVSRLPELEQEILRLAVWEGCSLEEIGIVVELSVDAVRTRLYRARQKLRQVIATGGPHE